MRINKSRTKIALSMPTSNISALESTPPVDIRFEANLCKFFMSQFIKYNSKNIRKRHNRNMMGIYLTISSEAK
jgi:hypothetical protein